MSKVQDIFNRIQETKKELREIKTMYRDAMTNSKELQRITDEIKITREQKKKIEEKIKDDFKNELNKMEELRTDIENDSMLLSDAALTQLMKGEMVEVTDVNNTKYEPLFSVKFKKAS